MSSIQNIAIIPEPVSVNISSGKFTLTEKVIIYSNPKLMRLSEYLKNLLFPATGFSLTIKEEKEKSSDGTSLNLKLIDNKKKLKSEGYTIDVSPRDVNISASNPTGIFYGIQTLRQLLPAELERNNIVENMEWEIPCLKLEDFPRFSWRGYMLDEARHFHGKQVVKNLLNLMAILKLNVFHWHLTDDQGWRIEIKKYPKLTEIGSKREETQVGGFFSKKTDGVPHSGYYSQEDIEEIIDYARDRFITIIPEIDIPGHSRAALASYPNISCKGYQFKVSTHWGIHKDIFCVGKKETFEFIQGVLDEIITLFPSKIIHIGGDEVLKARWKECPDCQLRIKNEGLKDEKQLKVYFINRVAEYLISKGQRVIGWNDILYEKLKSDIIIQYWLRGKKKVLNRLKEGGDVIMSNFKYLYLDHSYAFTPLNLAYQFEPIPKKLEKRYHKHVLGLEACMWGEFIPNSKRLEWQTFPRLIAFAEIGWTPEHKKDYNSFLFRLNQFTKRLDTFQINYAQLSEINPSFIKRQFRIFTVLKEQKGGV